MNKIPSVASLRLPRPLCSETPGRNGAKWPAELSEIRSRPENKVALGFVEGLNNKIRVIQRRSYGLHDEEYLRLKILTCMLEPI